MTRSEARSCSLSSRSIVYVDGLSVLHVLQNKSNGWSIPEDGDWYAKELEQHWKIHSS